MRLAHDPDEWCGVVALRCSACRELVPTEDIDCGRRAAISPCCGAVCGYVEREEPSAAEQHGPAWGSYVMAPRALLALPKDVMSPAAKLVALALFDYLHYSEIRPSQATIAAKAGLSDERTVRRALAELKARGLVTCSRRHGRDGSRAPDVYDVSGLVDLLNGLADESSDTEVPADLAGTDLPAETAGRTSSRAECADLQAVSLADESSGRALPAETAGSSREVRLQAETVAPTGRIGHDLPDRLSGELEVNYDLERTELEGIDALRAFDDLSSREDDSLSDEDSTMRAADGALVLDDEAQAIAERFGIPARGGA